MPAITYGGQAFSVKDGESVLDCLLRNGIAFPHSCKAGVCQSCLMRADSGRIPERATEGLRDTLRAQGYLLACSCHPENDLALSPPAADLRIPALIAGLDELSPTVLRVRIRPGSQFEYRAGQFITLVRPDGLARSYSLASLPKEDEIELHVRLIPGGAMSGWLRTEARPDAPVFIQGPSGNCFYMPENSMQNLILAGTGTGLAPLYGIARDALGQEHQGNIWLFHGALHRAGLYLVRELKALAAQHANFRYIPSVLSGDPAEDLVVGPMEECIKSFVSQIETCRAYVCGDPAIVNSLRMKLFLAGMASRAIYADAFIPSA